MSTTRPGPTNVALAIAKPGMSETLGAQLLKLVSPSRAELGCLRYEIHQSVQDHETWMILESCSTPSDFDALMKSSYVRDFLAQVPVLCVGDIEISGYHEVSASTTDHTGANPTQARESNHLPRVHDRKVRIDVSHHEKHEELGTPGDAGRAAKAVVCRNTEEVQGQGDFALFDELFADSFVDHTPQPGTTADKAGVLRLYKRLRTAFPDFRPEIVWQTVDADIVTTYKVYHGTHLGDFLGIAPTGKTVDFETVDAMRVRDGEITDHWGVANLYSVLQQLGQLPST